MVHRITALPRNEVLLRLCASMLTQAYRQDPAAVHALLCDSVICNNILAEHPLVQVESQNFATVAQDIQQPRSFILRPMGLINSVVSLLAGGSIRMIFNPEAVENGPRLMEGFGVIPADDKVLHLEEAPPAQDAIKASLLRMAASILAEDVAVGDLVITSVLSAADRLDLLASVEAL